MTHGSIFLHCCSSLLYFVWMYLCLIFQLLRRLSVLGPVLSIVEIRTSVSTVCTCLNLWSIYVWAYLEMRDAIRLPLQRLFPSDFCNLATGLGDSVILIVRWQARRVPLIRRGIKHCLIYGSGEPWHCLILSDTMPPRSRAQCQICKLNESKYTCSKCPIM